MDGAPLRAIAITCQGTHMTRFIYLGKSVTARNVAIAFVLQWAGIFGTPSDLVWSDLGPEFIGNDFLLTLSWLGVYKGAGPPACPPQS